MSQSVLRSNNYVVGGEGGQNNRNRAAAGGGAIEQAHASTARLNSSDLQLDSDDRPINNTQGGAAAIRARNS